jgi:hypothetical protein
MNPSFPDASARPGRRERIAWWLVYAGAAWVFNVAYWRRTAFLDAATLDALTEFKAATPFQLRVMMPALAHIVERIAHVPLPTLYFALSGIAVFGVLLAFEGYLGLFYSRRFAAAGTLLILYPLFWNYVLLNVLFYPYDMPAILFFILGLRLLIERRWALYYALFFIGTWNKETTCFLTLAMLAIYWNSATAIRQAGGRAGDSPDSSAGSPRNPAAHQLVLRLGERGILILHVLAQAALWLGVKITLGHLFAGNPGRGAFEHHINQNFVFLISWFVRPTTWNWRRLLTFGGVWALIPLQWPRVPPTLRRLLLVFPIFCVAMFLVGVLSEVRVFAEMIPVVLLPAMCAVWPPSRGEVRASASAQPGKE